MFDSKKSLIKYKCQGRQQLDHNQGSVGEVPFSKRTILMELP
jgi:hypothetical protein